MFNKLGENRDPFRNTTYNDAFIPCVGALFDRP